MENSNRKINTNLFKERERKREIEGEKVKLKVKDKENEKDSNLLINSNIIKENSQSKLEVNNFNSINLYGNLKLIGKNFIRSKIKIKINYIFKKKK
jgi:hypothetical protein